jgi:hypothetical protein
MHVEIDRLQWPSISAGPEADRNLSRLRAAAELVVTSDASEGENWNRPFGLPILEFFGLS